MIIINEWLPNPSGDDAPNEWIELWNSGSDAVNLNDWALLTKNGKTFYLNGYTIKSGEGLILPRTETKLTLKNSDEEILLYNNSKELVDRSSIFGTAQEGKSWSRIGKSNDSLWEFAKPTPGEENERPALALIGEQYPLGQALNSPSLSSWEVAGVAIGASFLITLVIFYAFKNHAYLQELFFHRN